MWCIPPGHDCEFVAAMEDVLEVYHRPYDERYPQVNLDETNKQLVGEVRGPLPAAPGQAQRTVRQRVRPQRHGEPVHGVRAAGRVAGGDGTDSRTRRDWAGVVKALVDGRYRDATKVVLVMDNLNTHSVASLYEAFAPAEARRIADKLEVHYTPKHGSWLNMAEIELGALTRQCLDERMEDKQTLQREVAGWQARRNGAGVKANWRFTTADARVKLRKLYPSLDG